MHFEGLTVSTTEKDRLISRPPTPEITLLASQIPNFYHRNNYYICSLAAINMIGSMLVSMSPDLSPYADENRFELPDLTLIHNIPLFTEDQQNNRLPLDFVAQDVLLKNACGSYETGVILNGPLAGLFIDNTYSKNSLKQGMVVDRVWNDDRLDYYIDTDGVENQAGKNNSAFILDGSRNRREKLIDLYKRIVKGDESLVWTTDLFFRLCHQLGYPIDESQFHYTRTI